MIKQQPFMKELKEDKTVKSTVSDINQNKKVSTNMLNYVVNKCGLGFSIVYSGCGSGKNGTALIKDKIYAIKNSYSYYAPISEDEQYHSVSIKIVICDWFNFQKIYFFVKASRMYFESYEIIYDSEDENNFEIWGYHGKGYTGRRIKPSFAGSDSVMCFEFGKYLINQKLERRLLERCWIMILEMLCHGCLKYQKGEFIDIFKNVILGLWPIENSNLFHKLR